MKLQKLKLQRNLREIKQILAFSSKIIKEQFRPFLSIISSKDWTMNFLIFFGILSAVNCEWANCTICDYEKPTIEDGCTPKN